MEFQLARVKPPQIVVRLVASLLTCLLIPAARSQTTSPPAWSGVLETYIQAARPTQGLFYAEDWLEIRYRISDDWRAVFTYDYQPSDFTFDANFLEYEQPDMYVRMGRFRSDFGFGQWSDTNYNVEVNDPLIRQDPILPNIGLNRLDIGAEYQKNLGIWQMTVSELDVVTGPVQMQPENLNWQQGRLQTQFEHVIVGVDGLVKNFDPRNPVGSMVGGDMRWSTPQFWVRGEVVRGSAPGYSTEGQYVDLTYRIPKFFRTELGVRNETFDVLGSGERTSLTTYGIRQIVNSSITLNLNYVAGKAFGDFTYMPGWNFQICYYNHF